MRKRRIIIRIVSGLLAIILGVSEFCVNDTTIHAFAQEMEADECEEALMNDTDVGLLPQTSDLPVVLGTVTNPDWDDDSYATAKWDSVENANYYEVILYVYDGTTLIDSRDTGTAATELDLQQEILYIYNNSDLELAFLNVTYKVRAVLQTEAGDIYGDYSTISKAKRYNIERTVELPKPQNVQLSDKFVVSWDIPNDVDEYTVFIAYMQIDGQSPGGYVYDATNLGEIANVEKGIYEIDLFKSLRLQYYQKFDVGTNMPVSIRVVRKTITPVVHGVKYIESYQDSNEVAFNDLGKTMVMRDPQNVYLSDDFKVSWDVPSDYDANTEFIVRYYLSGDKSVRMPIELVGAKLEKIKDEKSGKYVLNIADEILRCFNESTENTNEVYAYVEISRTFFNKQFQDDIWYVDSKNVQSNMVNIAKDVELKVLDAPQNVKLSDSLILTWDFPSENTANASYALFPVIDGKKSNAGMIVYRNDSRFIKNGRFEVDYFNSIRFEYYKLFDAGTSENVSVLVERCDTNRVVGNIKYLDCEGVESNTVKFDDRGLTVKSAKPENVELRDDLKAVWDIPKDFDKNTQYWMHIYISGSEYDISKFLDSGDMSKYRNDKTGKFEVNISNDVKKQYDELYDIGTIVDVYYKVYRRDKRSASVGEKYYVDSEEVTSNVVKYDQGVDKVTISPHEPIIYLNRSYYLGKTIEPVDSYYNEIKWSSSNPDTVPVDELGKITGKSVGTAEITAVIGKASDTVKATTYSISSNIADGTECEEVTDQAGEIIDDIANNDIPDVSNTDINKGDVDEIRKEIHEGIDNKDSFHTDIKAIQTELSSYQDNWGQIQKAANDLNAQFGGAYNIEVEMYHKDQNDVEHHIGNILELDNEITFTFDLPTGMKELNGDDTKKYVLVRVHKNSEGKINYDTVGYMLNGDGTFTVQSDSFSDFVWVEETGADSIVTISFDANGGNNIVPTKVVYPGKPFGSLPVPQMDGYVFFGWYSNNSFATDELVDEESIVPSGSAKITLYAKWKKIGFDYSVNSENKAVIDGYVGKLEGDLIIPSEIDGYSVVAISDSAFERNGQLGKLIIPGGVQHIGNKAFAGTKFNGSISLPLGVCSIGEEAFSDCGFVGGLELPSTIQTIGASAFANCSGLTGDIAIPTSVTVINDYTFKNCSGFDGRLIIPETVTQIGEGAFSGCTNLQGELEIPKGLEEIAAYTFADCKNVTGKLVIPSAVRKIGYRAFARCSKLSGVVEIPNCITDIGGNAFVACSSIDSVFIPDSVQIIGRDALASCISLNYIENDSYARLVLPYDETWRKLDSSMIISEIVKGIAIRDDYLQGGWGDIIPTDRIGIETLTDTPNGLWVAGVEDKVYTGKAITQPNMHVYDHNRLLAEKKDYTVKYSPNINEGNVTITISGKKNYIGNVTSTFTINPRNISDVEIDTVIRNYNNKEQKILPQIVVDKKKLSINKDFKLYDKKGEEVVSYKEPGVYEIEARGINHYSGVASFTFIVTNDVIATNVLADKLKGEEYTGEPIEPSVKLSYKGEIVTDCFSVTYANNVEVGKASVILTAKENTGFIGKKILSFDITGTSIAKAKLSSLIPNKVYDANAYRPSLSLVLNDKELVKDKDYDVKYDNCINAGTAKATVIGKGAYTGKTVFTYKILPYEMRENNAEKATINYDKEIIVPYERGGAKPHPVITFAGNILSENVDYKLSYANANSVMGQSDLPSPLLTVSFKGNYKGEVKVNYNIRRKDIADIGSIVISDKLNNPKKKYSWKQTAVTLVDTDGKKLVAKDDYSMEFEYFYDENCKNEITSESIQDGTVVYLRVKATDKNYYGQIVGSYVVAKGSIASAKIKTKYVSYEYTGNKICPKADEIIVSIGTNNRLVPGIDYIVVNGSYKNNINKGTASLTIKGIGQYSGTKVVKYVINSKVMKK